MKTFAKKSLSIILSVLMLISVFSVCTFTTSAAADGVSVTVKSEQGLFGDVTKTYQPGETFTLAYKLRSDYPVSSVQTYTRFDAQSIKVTAHSFNDILASSGSPFDSTQNLDNQETTNRATFTFYSLSEAADFSTESELVSYTFKVQDGVSAAQEIILDINDLAADITYGNQVGLINWSKVAEEYKDTFSVSAELSDPAVIPTTPVTTPETTAPATTAPATTAPVTEPGDAATVYFNADAVTQGNERYALYAYDNTVTPVDEAWLDVEKVSGNTYKATIPAKYGKFIFCRMNGESTENNWNNRWDQTENLTYDGTNDLYTVTGNVPDSNVFTGAWSVYGDVTTPATTAPATTAPATTAPVTEPAGKDTVYVNAAATSADNQDFYAWIWTTGADDGAWTKMEADANGYYTAQMAANQNVVFARLPGGETPASDWSNIWNQTGNLVYDGEKNLFTTTGYEYNQDRGKDDMVGTWSVYEAPATTAPATTAPETTAPETTAPATTAPVTEPAGKDTVYVNAAATSADNQDFYAWIWTTGSNDGAWTKMEADANGYYTAQMKAQQNVVFARLPGGETPASDWSNIWNQTGDLVYDGEKNLFTTTGYEYNQKRGKDDMVGTWSVYEAPATTAPATTAPATTAPATTAPETTLPAEKTTYNLYFAPLAADVDAGYTFRVNFQDATAASATEGWTTLTMTEVGGGVYKATAELAADMSVNKIQYQVWNGEAWVREYTIDGIAPLANYNNKVVTATSESAYELKDYGTEPETTAPATTAPVTDPVAKNTVYVNAAATSADNQDFYAWIWTTGADDGAWTKMEADANGYYTAQMAANQNVVFARLPGGETPADDWSNIWNQTGNLVYDGVNNLFTTTGYEYNQDRGKDDMVGTWSVLEAPATTAPATTAPETTAPETTAPATTSPVTEPAGKDTVYVNAAATSADNQDFYAWIWTTGSNDGAWTKMEVDANGYYTAQMKANQNVVFARLPGGETPASDWSNIWNQTGDLVYDGVNNLFTTTGYEYNQDRGKDDMVGTWSVLEAPATTAPATTAPETTAPATTSPATEPAGKDTVYVNAAATSADNQDFYAWIWTTGSNDGAWTKMEVDANGYYTAQMKANQNVVFARLPGGEAPADDWSNIWNQTGDLVYDGVNNLFTTTGYEYNQDRGKDDMVGTWSVLEAPATTAPVTEPQTTQPTGKTTYNLYFAPLAEDVDAGYTFKVNFQDATAASETEGWTTLTMTEVGGGVYTASAELAADMSVNKIQYQVWNGETWVREYTIDGIAPLADYNNKVVTATSESAYVITDYVVTTDPVTTAPATTAPVTTEPVTTEPVTTEPVTTEPVTTEPVTTEPVTTEPVTTEPVTTEPVTTEPVTTEPVTTEPVTTEPVTTEPVTTEPVTTEPVTTEPVTDAPTEAPTTAPVVTEPTTVAPTQPATKAPYLASEKKSMKAGSTYRIVVKNANGQKIKFKNNNSKIIKVTSKGKVTFLKKGTGTVTVTVGKKTLKFTAKVTSNPKLTKKNGKAIPKKGLTVKKGNSVTIKIKGKAKLLKNVYTNTKIAKIKGKRTASKIQIKGLKKGTTTLKIKVNRTKVLKVKVKVK